MDSYKASRTMVKPSPLFHIKTPNLFIRQTILEDLDFFISLYSDSKVMEKYSEGVVREPEKIREMININVKRWKDGNPYSSMSIFKNDTNDFIGNIFISTFNRYDNTGLLGYLLKHEHWSKGYGKESVLAMVKHYTSQILKSDKITKIVAYSRVDNLYSQKILKAAGFKLENTVHKYGANRFEYGLIINKLQRQLNEQCF